MTRDSCVSEHYLTHLEQGQDNITGTETEELARAKQEEHAEK